MNKMTKIDTLFMTKTAENQSLWGCTYLFSPYKGVPPPPASSLPQFHHVLEQTKITTRV